ncbi:MAG: vWA domain-containing protein [Spirochaetota bacterium]
MTFNEPVYLLFFIPFAVFTAFFWIRKLNRREYSVPISSVTVSSGRRDIRALTYPYLPVLRFLSIALLILSLAQPGRRITYSEVENYGVDIMIVQDISVSMLGLDFKPRNRLHVSKQLVKDFIQKRTTDRIGMVVFAGEAYLQAPLTTDYTIIEELIDQVEFDDISEEGTAIGNAIALASARMADSDTKSRIILLITDGASNAGIVDPETAARIAKESGIRIYTIGIGTKGEYMIFVPRGRHAGYHRNDGSYDEESLKEISDITGGKFYRATDTDSFARYIGEIDALEKSRFKVKQYHEFEGGWMQLLVAAFVLYIIEILLRSVFYRKIP